MRYDKRGFGRSGGFRKKRYNLPKPVDVGEEYDVEITEIGSKGDGIARIKNFIIFVSGANKGEKVRIKITDVMNRFAVAEKIGEATGEVEGSEESEETEEATEEAETVEEAAEVEEEAVEEAEESAEETEESEETPEEAEEESVEETSEEDAEENTEE